MHRRSTVTSADVRRLVDVVDAASAPVDTTELVPPDLLRSVAALISADDVSFEVLDPYRRTLDLQGLDPTEDGGVGDDDAALVNLWWRAFWESCSYPQRTGDFTTPWGSSPALPGPCNGRRWREFAEAIGLAPSASIVMSLDPHGSIDRRLVMWRYDATEFAEVDATLLTLVRPHINAMCIRRERAGAPTRELTPRQMEVLRWAATGCSTAEIAHHLVLSEGTVRKHLENIYRALDVQSRAAAVAWAVERGLA